jgi:hypothetical protein
MEITSMNSKNSDTGSISNNTTYLPSTTYNGSNLTIRLNGSQSDTTAINGNIKSNGSYMGIGIFPTVSAGSTCRYSEFILYATDNSSNVSDIESNINNFYSIY